MATNIPFLRAVLDEPDFLAGRLNTSFIEDHPGLLTARPTADRGTRLLTWLAEVTVNKPHGERPVSVDPATKLPDIDLDVPAPDGSRQDLLSLGPEAFARALREQTRVGVTDTTFRDAHQSLLATRVRTRDLLTVGGHVSRMTPELLSVEAWGGATYDVALRFLHEDPWDRLAKLRQAVPNICLQMLLRGRNTVGYTPYPTAVTNAFVQEAAETGIDIFRIFDALNDVEQMRPAIEAVRETGTTIAEVALCYTGDLSSPDEKLYTLDYYLGLAERIVDAGAHVLAIKDMAGLLRAPAARTLVTALRERFDLPVHLHTHDTPGGQLGTLLAAIDAGVDAVDAACASMAGTTSQPALSALVAATDHSDRETGLDLEAVCALEPYWEATRRVYAPFESGLASPTGRVYTHEIPGGQLSNLRQQAIALGLGEKFEQIEDMYAAANDILGNVVKVTPSSKVVGDLALHLVAVGADPKEFEEKPGKFDIPDSVIGFLNGELGDPPGGWPEPFRKKALEGRKWKEPVGELTDEQAVGSGGHHPPADPQRAALPRPDEVLRRGHRDVRRRLRARHRRLPLRPAVEHRARRRDRGGQAADPRAAGDQRGRRARLPLGDVHHQRPAAAGERPRRVGRVRRRRAGEGRPQGRQPGRRPLRRRGHPPGRGGRLGRGRRHRRHDRGDEDGGLDHRPEGRQGRTPRLHRHPAGRRRRPRPRPW